jgi:hypothetical protein
MLTSTKTIAMNEDILLHWIERDIFLFIALNEPKIRNVKAVYLHWCNMWVWQINTLRRAGPCVRWAELRMCSFWAGGISSFYRLLRRLEIWQNSTLITLGSISPNFKCHWVISQTVPLMTSPLPILNWNGLPRSRDESNFSPLVNVPGQPKGKI